MRLPETPIPLPALDSKVTYRENLIEAECETLDKMRKVAQVQGFTVYCDESERLGGDHTAPSPLGYFVAAIGFWLLTQVARYGYMLKLNVEKGRARVTMRNKTEGSVLQGSVQAACLGIESHLELESDEPPEKIAELVRYAENGCFTFQALINPVEVTRTVLLNGKPLETK